MLCSFECPRNCRIRKWWLQQTWLIEIQHQCHRFEEGIEHSSRNAISHLTKVSAQAWAVWLVTWLKLWLCRSFLSISCMVRASRMAMDISLIFQGFTSIAPAPKDWAAPENCKNDTLFHFQDREEFATSWQTCLDWSQETMEQNCFLSSTVFSSLKKGMEMKMWKHRN